MRSQMILRETSRPGAFIVDTFPPLASLPQWLRPGQSRAKAAAKEVLDIKMRLWQRIADQVASGKAPHCLARTIFEEKQHWYLQGLTDEDLAWVAGGLIEAGFETTAATLNTLVMMLATNPRVQREAQKELMRFVGPDRLPCFADLQKLPYVRACVKEALRMNPILAPGIMHFADQDVVYKDHIIPKGTVLVANTAFLHFDPGRFDKPFEFMPERYLSHTLYSSEYAAMGDPYKRDHFTFSTGRRTCPGARIAENSLGIALAGLLWAFEIRLPLVNQVEVQIDTSNHAFTDGGFAIPKPFAARFVPWTKEREQLVRDEWYRASKEGYSLRGAHTNVTGIVVS
ncbi:cytochrome P450 CYP2 subfamily [Colletotrichum graminicola M1.001]|uniref:Cytochrome P450 CYP2 subfamily n=1 Tax=Colletotrichum graminicola (strain M1.001 / M2 / FGSC 10212) TaxID=645133 RepID=E3QR72_COLGM|nr:cytochrome P450 CYP2 subfamily [Colletotrichum graminicola M1.001]EFQ33360.1 cytochrome P450 CYP2 subfamily [Colletotrichum graminicola M1.001]